MILSTHIVSDVEAAATRIALIARGRLVGSAAPEEMLRAVVGKVWEWVVPSDRLTAVRERHRVARGWILPFAWIWPLLVWSALGAREGRHGTAALIFSAPRMLARRLHALWLSGIVLTVAMGAGVGLRLVATGNASGALAWSVGTLFIPSLALAAGVWTGGGKLFEVLYLLLWYAGPMHPTRSSTSSAPRMPP